MTPHSNRLPPHTNASVRADRRSPHVPLRSGHRPSTRLVSEAVVASYLHDISQRHRHGVDAPPAAGARRPEHRA
jgi:hypothetical protein